MRMQLPRRVFNDKITEIQGFTHLLPVYRERPEKAEQVMISITQKYVDILSVINNRLWVPEVY